MEDCIARSAVSCQTVLHGRQMLFQRCSKHILIFKRLAHESHYEILKLKSDCTQKDIKRAFIELSKEHHPDMHPHKNTHEKYVKILNAYKALRTPASRAQYDAGLSWQENATNSSVYREYPEYRSYRRPSRPYTTYYTYEYPGWTEPHPDSRPRYQNPGIRNPHMIKICIGFFGVTLLVYFFTIWRLMNYQEDRKKRLQITATQLAQARDMAAQNGNESQIEHVIALYGDRTQ